MKPVYTFIHHNTIWDDLIILVSESILWLIGSHLCFYQIFILASVKKYEH